MQEVDLEHLFLVGLWKWGEVLRGFDEEESDVSDLQPPLFEE